MAVGQGVLLAKMYIVFCFKVISVCVYGVFHTVYHVFVFKKEHLEQCSVKSDVLSSFPLPRLITLIWNTVQSMNCKLVVCFMSNFVLFAIVSTVPSH